MEAKIGQLFDLVTSLFTGGDQIPWCDSDIVAGCEREVAESSSDEQTSDCIMRLSWALVHSKRQEDVQRGIAMLEVSLDGDSSSPLLERLYLLGIGLYRSGDYSKSRQLAERCLEIAPDWKLASSLMKVIENKIRKGRSTVLICEHKMLCASIAVIAVGVLACGLAAALAARKK